MAQNLEDKPNIIEAKSYACENIPSALENIVFEVSDKKEKAIAIFRAGKNETEMVNDNRLAYVKWHILTYRKRPDVFIYTRGEKSENEGKIEFYVSGKLVLIIIAPKNKTPCLNCCGNEIDYPQNLLKKYKPRKRK